ncbi:hypothetical protein JTE90_005921 [Oedothorax gibbosus]|uniref:TMEM205-like domain-containing protein n=1 Tax=Oedothorax gibbosus TaxID=931172 RepID=A0AAV6UAT8_9ARAC|nr:hypothetical protein JTE90_005921 [Oedothorax gibbosus]
MGSIPECLKVHRLTITLYIRLSKGVHPSALIGALATALLLFLALEGGGGGEGWGRGSAFVHLGAFATHFGTQIWMTFFSGIVLFFGLPRKAFGAVQRLLFPVYFALNTGLGLLSLLTLPPDATHAQRFNLSLLIVCDILGSSVIVPAMVRTLGARGRLEGDRELEPKERAHLLRTSKEYAQQHAVFRRLHGACALVNLLAMACNAARLYHLAGRMVAT